MDVTDAVDGVSNDRLPAGRTKDANDSVLKLEVGSMCFRRLSGLVFAACGGVLMLLMSFGCSTGSTLEAQAEEIEKLNEDVQERARRCAPQQLATAQAHVEFGFYELRKGDSRAARKHLERAERNARMARRLSDYDECELEDRELDLAVTEVQQADVDPVDFMWDSDGDGIPDHESDCPHEPIVFIGDPEQERTGCPNYDVSGDGVPNTEDHCPGIRADVDGFPGENGCPMLDIDGDGVLNVDSDCPFEPVEFIGYQQDTGCPNYDVDGDGIPNILDYCPFEPGPTDNDGCPVEEDRLAEVKDDRIELNQRVYFETAESEILQRSFPLLDDVAQILEEHPEITIRIEGHTDSRGSWEYNKRLSSNRAASVRDYLINRGISAGRMDSEGHSYDRPIDDNATEEGRAANRRVEIHITSQ